MATKYRNIPELTEQDIQRFWALVDKSPGQGPQGECWLWIGSSSRGYGRFSIAGRGKRANRVAYFIQHGKIPTLDVLHRCDMPACVRGDHLFLGTQKDNVIDAVTKGRFQHGERNGTKTKPESRPRGTAHFDAILNDDIVRQCRIEFEAGATAAELSRREGVSQHTMWMAVHRRTWTHIE